MKAHHVQIDKHGRLLVPAQIRNRLNYKAGDTFVVKADSNELHFVSLNKAIFVAQELFKSKNNNDNFAVDEFLQNKYQEAKQENEKFKK